VNGNLEIKWKKAVVSPLELV